MKTKILVNEFSPVLAPDSAAGAPAGGDASSAGPAAGGEAKPSKPVENIYGDGAPETGGDPETPETPETPEKPEGAETPESGGGEDFSDLQEFVEKEPEADPEKPAAGAPATPTAPALLKLDPESIAALRQQTAQPGQQQGEKLTPQQIRELLNPVEVTPETLKALGFTETTPEQVAGFQNFANAIVKNAYSLAKVMISKKEEQLMGMIQPLLGGYQEARVSQTKQAFFTKYPSLTKYEKLVKASAQEVSATNPDGSDKSQEQIFKEVAAATVATMRSLGITIQKPNANPGAAGGRPVPQPNKASPAGRSGGNGNAGGKPNDADADIYAR